MEERALVDAHRYAEKMTEFADRMGRLLSLTGYVDRLSKKLNLLSPEEIEDIVRAFYDTSTKWNKAYNVIRDYQMISHRPPSTQKSQGLKLAR